MTLNDVNLYLELKGLTFTLDHYKEPTPDSFFEQGEGGKVTYKIFDSRGCEMNQLYEFIPEDVVEGLAKEAIERALLEHCEEVGNV